MLDTNLKSHGQKGLIVNVGESAENQKRCDPCVPQDCDLFKKDLCKGKAIDGEFAVAKGSIRLLRVLVADKKEGELT